MKKAREYANNPNQTLEEIRKELKEAADPDVAEICEEVKNIKAEKDRVWFEKSVIGNIEAPDNELAAPADISPAVVYNQKKLMESELLRKT